MMIRILALLVLLPVFVTAMETHEEQPLLQIPPTNKMEKFNHQVDEINNVLDREMPQQKLAFVTANFAKAGCDLGCGIFLAGSSLICISSNPVASLMTMLASAICLCKTVDDAVYAESLVGIPDPSNRCMHTGLNALRLMYCIMPRQSSNAVLAQQPDSYEQI